MPYVVAIGHRVSRASLLERFSCEDVDELQCSLEEAGLSIFENDEDIFVTVGEKYKIISDESYVDFDLTLNSEEQKLLQEYTGQSDTRVKLFLIKDVDEDLDEILTNTKIYESMLSKAVIEP